MVRRGVVPRPELMDRLQSARTLPTVAVVAPAGYGKTTLLALWTEADDRRFAWLSLDSHDNDPIVLLTHLAVAIDRKSPLPPDVFDALRTAGASVAATVVPRLGWALGHLSGPLVVVLDDVHHLEPGPSLDALVTLVGHVRGTTQIALAGRSMPVPLARIRTQGRVLEIGADALAFPPGGARSLLRAAGADLPDDEADELARRTEGWAAGLYLAALARTGNGPSPTEAAADDGDRLIADYLRFELLSRLSQRDLAFLNRTAVLDRMCGPLCDAVLEETGSTQRLEQLRTENLFLVPLDGRAQWYRYHPLFRDLLRETLDDGERPALLRRAAEWSESQGELEAALHYAQEAGDIDRVARIAIALAQPMYAAGRSATLMGWFDWVDAHGALERYPAISPLAAFVCALTGRPAAADRWWELAERWADGLEVAEMDPMFAEWLPNVRAAMCHDGVEQMRRDVEDGAGNVREVGSVRDPEYPMRMLLGGVAHLLLGHTDTAEARLDDAVELITGTLRHPLLAFTLAHRALVAVERRNGDEAEACISRALSVVRHGHAEAHVTSALPFAMAARLAMQRSDLPLARAHLAQAQRLRPLLSHAIPWYAVETLLEMSECAVGLGDASAARAFLRDADAVRRRRPSLGRLGERTDDLRARLGALPVTPAAGSTLTSAELRLLPLLVTHLPLAAIADRLFVSRHTVKAQVWSMYRKLDVHTRSDLVVRARDAGLLEA
ncbi:MAG TPA: LuxR C-terminal-related transcriptional regulator [Blastococcus sp.]|nr:LuxR C-terminal-related transcriptional regulator [Blastococcus sp.]